MEGNIVRDNCNYSPATVDMNLSSKLHSWCNPVVDLRAYKEKKIISHKPKDVGQWIYKNRRPWMICPGSEVFDSSFSPSSNDKPTVERRQRYSKKKQSEDKLPTPKIRDKLLKNKIEKEDVYMENKPFKLEFREHFSHLPDVEGSLGQKDDISALKRVGMQVYRCRLEKEVERLQGILKQKQEISTAFETALSGKPGASSQYSHLPLDAEELLADVAMLEADVSRLAEQTILLLSKLKYKCPQHRIFETLGDRFPCNISSP